MHVATERIRTISSLLIEAENSCVPVTAGSGVCEYIDLATGYSVQLKTLETRLADGASVIGAKAAFTNRAVQEEYGVEEPVSGFLLDRSLCPNGAGIAFEELIEARAEAEIAFVMATELAGPGVSAARALNAVAGIMPAIEVVDCRFLNWRVTPGQVAADSACGSRVVLGAGLFPVAGIDLRLLGVAMEKNGEVVATGAGAAAMGSPAEVLAWVANNIGKLGHGLHAGDVVITGTVVRAQPIAQGDRFTVNFHRLGAVSVNFT